MASKVYSERYTEAWVSFQLSGDPELMYCHLGMIWPIGGRPVANVDNANAIAQPLVDAFINAVPVGYTIKASHVLFGVGVTSTDDTPPVGIDCTTAGVPGEYGGTNPMLPQNCALLVRKSVAGGKPGRMYVPGLLEEDVSPTGAVGSTPLATLQAVYTGMYADVVGLVVDGESPVPGLMSKVSGSSPAAYILNEITSLTVDSRIATQRRRLRR